MPPRASPAKRTVAGPFSPSKPSPLSKRLKPTTPTKQRAGSSPGRSPSKRATPAGSPLKPRRVPHQQIRDEDGEGDEDEEEEFESEYSEDEEDEAGERLALVAPGTAPESFITRSAGDAYLLQASTAPKTSDHLLSTALDPAFTFSNYQSALQSFDSSAQPNLVAARAAAQARVDAYARKHPLWAYQLDQGFSLAFYGFGSKKAALDSFAEFLRERGTVIVANGYDPAVALADVVGALEDVFKAAQEAEGVAVAAASKSRKRGRQPATPAKPKQATNADAAPTPGAAQAKLITAAPPTQVSALEGRVRRFCASLRSGPSSMGDLYLVVHSLDSASLRQPKTLALLALLAAQPRLHLVISTDHIRAAAIFPTALATARPPSQVDPSDGAALDARAFSFLHVELTTLASYSQEVLHSGVLSTLFPPTIYPPISTSLDPSSASLMLSTTHVLLSVTARSRRLFHLLATVQLDAFALLPPQVSRSLLLTPKGPLAPAPIVATKLDAFKSQATDNLYATSGDQVDALLAEFRDHAVVRGSKIAPVAVGAEGAEAVGEQSQEGASGVAGGIASTGAEWIWIPLGKDALQEVVDEMDQ